MNAYSYDATALSEALLRAKQLSQGMVKYRNRRRLSTGQRIALLLTKLAYRSVMCAFSREIAP